MPCRRSRRPASLQRRLMQTLLLRLGVGLAIAAVGTFIAVHTVLTSRLDSQLDGTAQLVDQYAQQTPPGTKFDFAAGIGSAPSPGSGASAAPGSASGTGTDGSLSLWHILGADGLVPVFIEVRALNGSVVFNSSADEQPQLPAIPQLGPPGSGVDGDRGVLASAAASTGSHGAPSYRVRTSLLPNGHGYLILADSEQDVTDTMGDIGRIEVVAWVVAFCAVGWLAHRRIRHHLRPFEQLGDQIVAIGAGELDRRVDPSDPATEVGRVGSSVNSMLARLEEAFSEQRASEDRLRRFIADASHELRTPLASIRGYAELFRRGAASRPEDLALAMRRIESESARMGVLVDELLLLARLDAGRPLAREPVDVCALARDAVRDSLAADPRWPVDVVFGGASGVVGRPKDAASADGERRSDDAVDGAAAGADADAASGGPEDAAADCPIEVQGDADRLRQVLANLLSNVRAHTPVGTPATVSVRRDGDSAVIDVCDAGPGLSERQAERVFERFYRADASRRRGDGAAGGSGLGLSIVASVAAAHGGAASVHSLEGCGTVFTVRLPLDGAVPRAAEGAVAAAAPGESAAGSAAGPDGVARGPGAVLNDHGGAARAGAQVTGPAQRPHRAGPGAAGFVSPQAPDTGPAHGGRRSSGTMERLTSLVLRRRRAVYAFWLIALVVGGLASATIANHLDPTFSMPGQPGYVANQQITAHYGDGGALPPLVPVAKLPAGTAPDSARVQQAFSDLERIPGVRVADYADTGDKTFLGADSRTTFALVYTPGAQGMGSDGAITALEAQIQTRLAAALPAGTTLKLTGEVPLESGGSGSSKGLSVLNEVLIGAFGALAVLLFVFASLLALVPLLIAAVSVLTAYLAVLGVTEITSVSVIVQFLIGLIGLGVAIDYSLLLVTRWREELAHGHDNEEALRRAMNTAGRAVAFSGVTVALGLLSLIVLPVPFLRSIGYGGMIIPLVSVCVTLTLVPALLSGIGRRLDWPRLRHEETASRGWTGWARLVVRRRWIAAAGALAVLGALAFSAVGMRIGDPSSASLAQSGTAHDGVVMLQQADIPAGVLTPFEVLVPRGTSVQDAVAAVKAVPGVRTAVAPTAASWQRPGSSLVLALPSVEGTSTAGETTTRAVRAALAAVPGTQLGGMGATEVDMIHAVYGTFPLMLATLGVLTFILLARAFRSIVLPLKAVLLNLMSLAAVYGVLVLVWQKGYVSNAVWGIPATGAITAWIPLMVFAFLFGLSMDYEVFILSRMREEYDTTGSTPAAVVTGIGRTGRLVTSAALILFLAMAALGSAPNTQVKIFATAMGAGILLDATVVRALLVPALISLFGRWNWWLPGPVAKVLRVEPSPARRELPGDATPPPAPEPAAEPEGAPMR